VVSGLCRLRGGLYGPPTGIINLMCAVCALSHFLSLRSSDPVQLNLNQPTLDQLQGGMFASPWAHNLLQLVMLHGNKELTMSGLCRLRGGLYGPPTGIINLMCAVCALSHFLSLRSPDPVQLNLNQPTLDQLQGDMFASPCS